MSFEWSQVQPGDVLVWTPIGGKVSRRVLVEEIDEEPSIHGYRWVWGVETSSRYGIRARRGARDLAGRKPFMIRGDQVTDTARGGERIAALQAHITKLRARREGVR